MQNNYLKTPLLDQIISYSEKPKIPFHMPGHAGGKNIHPKMLEFFGLNMFKADLTELDELDNLNNPQSYIRQTQEKIASIFEAKASFLLINGSTLGLMALILSIASRGDKILVPRNCHRAVINALVLSGAQPIWFLPEWLSDWELYGHICPEKFDEYLDENQDIKAALIVNPTYEGIVSDTRGIATICEKYGIPLIVDEAHGGHWKFHNKLPDDATTCGADAVVQSFHKSCGSLSQSSLLHLSKKSKFSVRAVEETLKLLQSTSPSYILMASLDASSSYLASEEGYNQLNNTIMMSQELRTKLCSINSLSILHPANEFTIDPTRLFVKIQDLSGDHLADILEDKYNIAIESLNNTGNLFFLNIGNTQEDFNILYKTLKEISSGSYSDTIKTLPEPQLPNMANIFESAFFGKSEPIRIKDAIGRINRYPMVKCPPGVCMLIPGEIITEYHLEFFNPYEVIEVLV